MGKNKKYPPIVPKFDKDKKHVYLDIKVYESIFEEINDLNEKIKKLDQKKKTPKVS